MPRIPVAIVTGFLGSGKTTLLNQALRVPAMARTAVVVNEFGEVGLDHMLVEASGDSVVLLENGCLCCTVRGDLVAALDNLYWRRARNDVPAFDRVAIETSGLADPSPVIQALTSEPTLAERYYVGALIAAVDAVNAPATLDAHVESVRQVALAEHIVLTKLDLLAPAARTSAAAMLHARLRTINRMAAIIAAEEAQSALAAVIQSGEIDPLAAGTDVRRWLNVAAFADASHTHGHGNSAHHHGPFDRDIASFCIVRDVPLSHETLRLLLAALNQNLGPNLLRVKGFVHVAEHPDRPALVQGAQQLLHPIAWLDRWPDDDRRTRLVFITQGAGRDVVADMIGLIERMARRTAQARKGAGDG